MRKLIGIHRARFLVTGAAPISPELVKWYLALGVPMLEVWGMTETCGASTGCLLYTSDAADDLRCVDTGGRRIIKKNKNTINYKNSYLLLNYTPRTTSLPSTTH